jgi:hypothetical protein
VKAGGLGVEDDVADHAAAKSHQGGQQQGPDNVELLPRREQRTRHRKEENASRSSHTGALSKANVMERPGSFKEGGQGGSNVTLAPMNSPIMIACAHGTSNTQGAAEVNALRDGIAALRPGLDVREAYVDVQQPDLVDVVAGLPAGESAVVVPLLLSVGYHVKVDIARAVKSRPGSAAAAPLGPDPRLAALLDQRLREAGVTDRDVIVLAAAGSSNPKAAISVQELLGQLQELRPTGWWPPMVPPPSRQCPTPSRCFARNWREAPGRGSPRGRRRRRARGHCLLPPGAGLLPRPARQGGGGRRDGTPAAVACARGDRAGTVRRRRREGP